MALLSTVPPPRRAAVPQSRRSTTPPSGEPVLERLVEGPSFSLTLWKEVLALVWHEVPSAEGYRQAYGAAKLIAQRSSGRQVAVLSLTAHRKPPDNETRAAIEEILQDPARIVCRSAVVHEGGGFITASVHSMVLNLLMGKGSRVPHRAFPELSDALAWLCSEDPKRAPSKNVVDFVARKLREGLTRRA